MNRAVGILGRVAGFAALLALPLAAVAATEHAARVEGVKGTVEAVSPDQTVRKLDKGAPVNQGDRIQTGKGSWVDVRFRDGSQFEIGQNGVFQVDKYADKEAESIFATRILRGAFRFLTGAIARRNPRSMGVELTVATIGIRGTHVVGEVDETSARIILAEPEDKDRKTAVEVSNQYGAVTIDQPGYGTEIPDQFSPPSPVRRMQVNQIQDMLRSMRQMQMNVPRMPR